MTQLMQMMTSEKNNIKNATHLDLLKAIQEIDYGSTNWLHGREEQSSLWNQLSGIRNTIAKELCERLDTKSIQKFPYGSEPQLVNEKSILELCKELDENQVVLPQSYFALELKDVAKANGCEIEEVNKHIEELESQGYTFEYMKQGELIKSGWFKQTDKNWKYPSYFGSDHHRSITEKYNELRDS